MSAGIATSSDRRLWLGAGAGALLGHVALVALALMLVRHVAAPDPEPVVMIELPPMTAPVVQQAQAKAQPQALMTPPRTIEPPVSAPRVDVPLPADVTPLPAPPPRPLPPAPVALPEPAPSAAVSATPAAVAAPQQSAGSDDPKARRQELDYFRTLSAHLNRKKVYPAEARQARQQGIVTVRFTVDRAGNVSAVSIKQSSGHMILDDATLSLLLRVAPLPPMPASMHRDRITLSLPIDYSLRTS